MPRNDRNKKDVKRKGKREVNIASKGTVTVINGGQVKRKRPVKPPVKSPVKQQTKSVKTPGGRGLGKAGAKRLGQLLKRAIQEKNNVTGNEKAPLPMTPVRLFKYQTQAEAASKTNEARHVVTRVSQLILRVVSQCKHMGGISMVDLKHALAAGGYDVTKNNTRVNLAVKGLVRKETLVQTTGAGASGSFKLNKKKIMYEKSVKTRAMRDCAAVERAKQREHAAAQRTKQKNGILKPTAEKGKALKPTGKALKPGAKPTKPAGKALKPGAKTTKAVKPTGKTAKPAGKSPKPASKDKTVVGKAQRAIGYRPKQVGKASKPPAKVQKTGCRARKPAGKALKEGNRKTRKIVVTPQ